MQKIPVLVLLLLFVFSLQQGDPYRTVRLWPLPKSFTNGSTTLFINDPCSFNFIIDSPGDPTDIKTAINMYRPLIFPTCKDNIVTRKHKTNVFPGITIQVQDPIARPPRFDTDESYTLKIPLKGVGLIKANTYVGLLRALETLSQIIMFIDDSYQVQNAPWIIEDEPRYKHRGILLDTSRHWFPVKDILRQIDGLMYSKMNVFHWHISDSQSFPLELRSFPEITKYGAFSQKDIYTIKDVQMIVKYATQRGVRVIPEMDMPGHARSWGLAPKFRDITACGDLDDPRMWPLYCGQPPCGQLDPTVDLTYEVVKGVLEDLQYYFPSEFIHMGFDEVFYRCWEYKSSIPEWMRKNGIKTYGELFNYFLTRVRPFLAKNRTAIYWINTEKEVKYPEQDIIQVWGDRSQVLRVLKEYKNRIIVSPYNAVYLDCGFGNVTGHTAWCPYNTWLNVYQFEPEENVTSQYDRDRILGSEAAMWTELTDTYSLDNKIWPRASALGERLWSRKEVRDIYSARLRLSQHADRLAKRGINPTGITETFCMYHPEICYSP